MALDADLAADVHQTPAAAAMSPARRDRTELDRSNQRSVDFMQKERERQRAACVKKLANRPRVTPTSPVDKFVTSTGERQLLALNPRQLEVIDDLLSKGVHRANQALRTGRGLSSSFGPSISLRSYESNRDFYKAACAMLAWLGSSLTMDSQVELYRGIAHVPGQHSAAVTLQSWLGGGSQQQELIDLGFGFAATIDTRAESYTWHHPKAVSTPVLLHLTAHRGLCIPEPSHRNDELSEHLCAADVPILRGAIGQVIFPLETRWRLISVQPTSSYGMPVVHMEQVTT